MMVTVMINNITIMINSKMGVYQTAGSTDPYGSILQALPAQKVAARQPLHESNLGEWVANKGLLVSKT